MANRRISNSFLFSRMIFLAFILFSLLILLSLHWWSYYRILPGFQLFFSLNHNRQLKYLGFRTPRPTILRAISDDEDKSSHGKHTVATYRGKGILWSTVLGRVVFLWSTVWGKVLQRHINKIGSIHSYYASSQARFFDYFQMLKRHL